ncbi:DUF4381 domain-containing protein [Thalassotalea sediminis]|uniref:DUF4381 domain-containing protein n=1 Tax=Thalassotalea sediminis TaxID=1759089 RepID=UPI002573569C|nr:DUF4381 domain-containing protein [Thalassotalea sediminis]
MDPLAQLKDIHLPEQVHQWPIAYGWWLLCFTLITVLLIVIVKSYKKRKLLADKKTALQRLKNPEISAEQIVTLLKWVSIRYFNRSQIAKLHGKEFTDFLLAQVPEKKRAQFSQELPNLVMAHYRNDENQEALVALKAQAQMWISYALPPKQKSASTLELVHND